MRPMFTPEELAEMAAADEEIEAQPLTMEEIREARARDKAAIHERKDKRGQKLAENQRAYREANREKIAENKHARRTTPEGRKAYNAYMREYMRKRCEKKKEVST